MEKILCHDGLSFTHCAKIWAFPQNNLKNFHATLSILKGGISDNTIVGTWFGEVFLKTHLSPNGAPCSAICTVVSLLHHGRFPLETWTSKTHQKVRHVYNVSRVILSLISTSQFILIESNTTRRIADYKVKSIQVPQPPQMSAFAFSLTLVNLHNVASQHKAVVHEVTILCLLSHGQTHPPKCHVYLPLEMNNNRTHVYFGQVRFGI